MTRRVAVVMSGFPRVSETFALPELDALDRCGALGPVFSTKEGDGNPAQPEARALLGRVERIPEGDLRARSRWLASRLADGGIAALHGYFAHEPTALAEATADLLGLPFGFSSHAKDVRKLHPGELARRAQRARCVVACNDDVAATLERAGASVELIPHGVALERFQPGPTPPAGALRILAVGRCVEKKGFRVLLEACARLAVPYEVRVVGDGPERRSLESLACRLGIRPGVTFAGIVTHETLPSEYRWSDVVVVPSVVDRSGDRDGLPNVVLEALASGRAVVGTRVGAIASVLVDRVNGLLVEPGDPVGLARALASVADPDVRRALGQAGRQTVRAAYDAGARSRMFADTLGKRYEIDAG